MPANHLSSVGVVEIKVMEDTSKPLNSLVVWWSGQWRAFLAEFIATTLLVFFGCMSCIPLEGFPTTPPMYIPFGFGLIVLLNVQIFGHISGAQMNPAVTLGSVVWGGNTIARGLGYCVSQTIGACLGYGILVAVAPLDIAQEGICVTTLHSGISSGQALVIEIILTAILSFINCSLWDPVNTSWQDSAPIKFGLAVAGMSIAAGPLTGANLNPARTLATAWWTGLWTNQWVYCCGPFIGSAFAAVLYKFTWLKDERSNIRFI